MSQRNYLYELEKFLKEYGHNEELSILTACQKASMNDEIFKSAGGLVISIQNQIVLIRMIMMGQVQVGKQKHGHFRKN